jgi:hypothetical protein
VPWSLRAGSRTAQLSLGLTGHHPRMRHTSLPLGRTNTLKYLAALHLKSSNIQRIRAVNSGERKRHLIPSRFLQLSANPCHVPCRVASQADTSLFPILPFASCKARWVVIELLSDARRREIEEVGMLRIRRKMMALIAGTAICALMGCQSTSTSGTYRPANCAMVGSSCSAR